MLDCSSRFWPFDVIATASVKVSSSLRQIYGHYDPAYEAGVLRLLDGTCHACIDIGERRIGAERGDKGCFGLDVLILSTCSVYLRFNNPKRLTLSLSSVPQNTDVLKQQETII